jgi:hypothetical protein
MASVRKHTYELAAWPFDRMPWVRVPEGLEFTWYELTTLPHLGTPVDADSGDEARWCSAGAALAEELQSAERDLRYAHGVRTKTGLMVDRRTVRLRRYDLLPGRGRRSRRAFARCESRMRAADAAYRPIREEIEARIARARASPDGRGRETDAPTA